jgi:hypothetical protein
MHHPTKAPRPNFRGVDVMRSKISAVFKLYEPASVIGCVSWNMVI